jgi:hypothetical protein
MAKKIDSKENKPNNPTNGIHNSFKDELIPKFIATESEHVIAKGNAWIVLGRDRPADISSGYGGKGHSRASSIDLVVGRFGHDPSEADYVDNNFGALVANNKPGDAARIYLSQRADIDDYLGLCDGSQGRSTAKSAIGMIADDVRIVARRGLKIVTGKGPKQQDSLGQKINFQFGVDIIAGNLDFEQGNGKKYLQPMVKGDNLAEALVKINNEISALNSILNQFVLLQMKFNSAVMTGFSTGFAAAIPVTTTPSPGVIAQGVEVQTRTFSDVIYDLIQQRNVVLNAIKLDYLSSYGSDYICSKHNRVN